MIMCEGCGKKIYEKKERYTHVEDWAFGECDGGSWWHLICFKKSIGKDLDELKTQASLMIAQAGEIFNKFPLPKEIIKEYEIK